MIKVGGTYKAKAVEVTLGSSRSKGTPFVGVIFSVTDGPFTGERLKWDGWLTERTAKRTLESLQHCGWTGSDISVFAGGNLNGIDKKEVELVVEMEDYQGTDESKRGRQYPKVQWVNRSGGSTKFGGPAMNVAQAAEFGQRFRGLALELQQKSGSASSNGGGGPGGSAGVDADDLPFIVDMTTSMKIGI